MPALLTAASVMMCPHGGTISATPGATNATADASILRGSDTFTIAGCSFTLPGPVSSPCVSVNWVQTATHLKHGGDFVLNEASVGLCLAGTQAPQGTVQVSTTQSKVSGL